jgi:hypothetical protein
VGLRGTRACVCVRVCVCVLSRSLDSPMKNFTRARDRGKKKKIFRNGLDRARTQQGARVRE